jgi:hypothetical protein
VLCLRGVRGQPLPAAGDAVLAAHKITE